MTSMKNVPALVKRLYKVVEELGKLPGAKDRRFTPDGHLVGSIGEILAISSVIESARTEPQNCQDGDLIEQNSFEILDTFANIGFSAPVKEAKRLIYVVRKP